MKLALEFSEKPKLVVLVCCSEENHGEKTIFPAPGTDQHISWGASTKAIALFFICWKIHKWINPKVAFQFEGGKSANPAQSLGDAVYKDSTTLLDFLAKELKIRFQGSNMAGKNPEDKRVLYVNNFSADSVEILWKRNGLPHNTGLAEWQQLVHKIFMQVTDWDRAWIVNPPVSELLAAIPTGPDGDGEQITVPDLTPEEKNMEEKLRKAVMHANASVRLIGIRRAANVDKFSLKTSFVSLNFVPPASVKPNAAESLGDSGRSQRTKREQQPINLASVLHISEKSRKCLITGLPGGGKTTLTRMLAFQIAAQTFDDPDVQDILIGSVPLLIKVRDLHGKFDKLPSPAEIVKLNLGDAYASWFKEEYVAKIFDSGRAVLVVDGLDECELPKTGESDPHTDNPTCEWNKLMEWLNNLSRDFKKIRLITTSRPLDARLSALEGFDQFKVEPFSLEQQKVFADHWFQALLIMGAPQPDSKRGAEGLKRTLEIEPVLQAQCKTPLLLSAACALHYEGKLDTSKLTNLLHQFFDLLLDEWRRKQKTEEGLREDILNKIEKTDLKALVARLAYAMVKQGKWSADEQFIKSIFQEGLDEITVYDLEKRRYRKKYDLTQAEILATVRDRAGVLVLKSVDTYEFTHEQFPELLTAHYLTAQHELDELVNNSGLTKWDEVIKFAVDSLKGGQQTLVRSLLLKKRDSKLAEMVASRCGALTQGLYDEIVDAAEHCCNTGERFDEFCRILAKIGSTKALAKLFHLTSSMEVLSGEEFYSNVVNWKFNQIPIISTASMAKLTAHRCYFARTIFGGSYKDNLNIFCFYRTGNDLEHFDDAANDDERSASWQSLSLGIKTSEDKNAQGDESSRRFKSADFRYAFAVMLDTSFKSKSTQALFLEGFEMFLKTGGKNLLKNNLLPLFLFQCVVIDNKITFPLELILQLLESVPNNLSPAIQIGLLNSSVDLQHRTPEEMQRATKLWWRNVDSIETAVIRLISAFHNEFGVEVDGKVIHAPKDEITESFKKEFRKELNRISPTPFVFKRESKVADNFPSI